MNETKRKIAEYKEKLPGLKEKVVGVALLLVIAVVMVATVSFAWLSISTSPEVSGVSTSVSANGNLEIALASGERSSVTAPAESQVGDSKLPLLEKNITWGNLVNLSDANYGLDNLVLRPAMINMSNLLDSPLYGAVYSDDGRIDKLTSNFGFASWVPESVGTPGYFAVSEKLGVRAISSTKYEDVGYPAQYAAMKDAAESANASAGNAYLDITHNEEWMKSLATVMGTYMTASLNATQGDESLTNPTMDKADAQNLRDMFKAFEEAFEKEADALATLANFQLFVNNQGETDKYTPYTAATLFALVGTSSTTTNTKLNNLGLQIRDLYQFKKDYDQIHSDYESLVEICELATIKWTDSKLNDIINRLVNVGACTLQVIGSSDAPVKISSIGASNAAGYLNQSCSAVITNGILYRFENRIGSNMKVGEEYNGGKGLAVSATVKRGFTVSGTVYAHITTSAEKPSLFSQDMQYGVDNNKGGVGTPIAKDTYGLAIDLWVRTNAQNSYLILEGNVLTETKKERAMGKDANGNEVELYTVTITETGAGEDGEDISYSIDVYKVEIETEDGTTVTWYNASTYGVVSEETLNGQTPTAKMNEVEYVLGYEGENRVWGDNDTLSVNSTAQGSGSCYVYYADTPEDQARSLSLLDAMNVVFVDDEGNLMATAYMDTNRYYADNGKVIVPLVLSADSISLGTDYEGNTTLAITALEQNVPTLITAVVYLDGTKLTNEDVLAAADIQGQLNIQFGSSTELMPIEDEKLQSEELVVSASVDKTSFDYDTATEPMTTDVTVNVDGNQPETVTAFFIRSINSTQGSREEKMIFTDEDGDGNWTSSYTFKYPGNYILRSVQLDGVEHDLKTRPAVTVTGFALSSLTWNTGVTGDSDGNSTTIMTASGSSSVDVYLKFATDDESKLPKSVQGRFMREDGTVANINFTYTPAGGTWSGKATFVTSGEYTLQYLVLDDNYTEIPENMRKYATVYLGMKVAVYTDSLTNFLFQGDDHQPNLYMKVKIMDDTGKEMQGLSGVKLYYGMQGYSVEEMGMDANLTWNGVSQYYEGSFASKIGMYDFLRVDVGGNSITNATTAPSFMIVSPTPPTFNSGATISYQYKPDPSSDPAKMSVVINDCDAAVVKAVLVKDGVEMDTPVDGKLESGHWTFVVPITNNAQDGIWTIKEIRISGVYSEAGNLYTENNPLVFDITGEQDVTTKVVSTLKVNLDKTEDVTYSGEFLQSYTLDKFGITITDNAGEVLPKLSDTVTLKYNYDGATVAYGGYSVDNIANIKEEITVTLSNQDGKYFLQSGDNIVLQYAGTYTLAEVGFTLYVDNVPYVITLSGEKLPKAPTFTVKSTTPEVNITDITPDGSPYSVDLNTSGSIADTETHKDVSNGWLKDRVYTCHTNAKHIFASSNTDYLSRIEKNNKTAWLYFKCTHDDVSSYSGGSYNIILSMAGGPDWDYHQYEYNNGNGVPSATITLSNIGYGTKAVLQFAQKDGATVQMFTQYTKDSNGKTYWADIDSYGTDKYEWSKDGACLRFVGAIDNVNDRNGNDTKTPAGTLIAEKIVLTDSDGNTYTVDLGDNDITIHNPY